MSMDERTKTLIHISDQMCMLMNGAGARLIGGNDEQHGSPTDWVEAIRQMGLAYIAAREAFPDEEYLEGEPPDSVYDGSEDKKYNFGPIQFTRPKRK